MPRVRAGALVAILGLVAAACVPPLPGQTLKRDYSESTAMGEAQEAGRLRIGVPADAPPLGFMDPQTQEIGGLAVSLGRLLARTLGVRAEFVVAPSPRLLELIDSAEVDVAFPDVPLTEEEVRAHSFTNPYLVTHQRLLVPRTSPLDGLHDLGGRTVCAAINEATQVSPRRLEPSVAVVRAAINACAARLRRGEVDAVTGGDVFLEWVRRRLRPGSARIVGDQLSTEGYGAAVAPGGGWLPFVNAVFAASEEDGTWAAAYERWIGKRPGEPPELTAEEAAALFPSGAGG
jgi:polar amino acid transport system substrate-binding protein